jgi:hypothetical protein
MADKNTFHVEFEILQTGEKIVVNSLDEFQKLIEIEYLYWRWISQLGYNDPYLNNAISILDNLFNKSTHYINQVRSKHETLRIDVIWNHLDNWFNSQGIPLSTSLRAQFIESLKSKNIAIAASAFASLFQQQGQIQNASNIRGIIAMWLYDFGLDPSSSQALKNRLEKQLISMQIESKKLQETVADDDLKLHETIKSAQVDFEKWLNNSEHMTNEQKKYWSKMTSTGRKWLLHKRLQESKRHAVARKKAEDEYSKTLQAFREQMKLKGPVEYWEEKSKSHLSNTESRAKSLRNYIGVVSLVGLIVLTGASLWLPTLIKQETPWPIVGFWTAITLLVATVIIWIGRIKVRLYLSEHHLAIDAKERATMAMTYLALTAQGAAEEKDRSIVLAALFRPSTDGVVKDDAAPEFGLANLLSKAASK